MDSDRSEESVGALMAKAKSELAMVLAKLENVTPASQKSRTENLLSSTSSSSLSEDAKKRTSESSTESKKKNYQAESSTESRKKSSDTSSETRRRRRLKRDKKKEKEREILRSKGKDKEPEEEWIREKNREDDKNLPLSLKSVVIFLLLHRENLLKVLKAIETSQSTLAHHMPSGVPFTNYASKELHGARLFPNVLLEIFTSSESLLGKLSYNLPSSSLLHFMSQTNPAALSSPSLCLVKDANSHSMEPSLLCMVSLSMLSDLCSVVEPSSLDVSSTINKIMEIGKKHHLCGIEVHFYPLIMHAIMQASDTSLSPAVLSSEVKVLWCSFLFFVTNVMIEGVQKFISSPFVADFYFMDEEEPKWTRRSCKLWPKHLSLFNFKRTKLFSIALEDITSMKNATRSLTSPRSSTTCSNTTTHQPHISLSSQASMSNGFAQLSSSPAAGSLGSGASTNFFPPPPPVLGEQVFMFKVVLYYSTSYFFATDNQEVFQTWFHQLDWRFNCLQKFLPS